MYLTIRTKTFSMIFYWCVLYVISGTPSSCQYELISLFLLTLWNKVNVLLIVVNTFPRHYSLSNLLLLTLWKKNPSRSVVFVNFLLSLFLHHNNRFLRLVDRDFTNVLINFFFIHINWIISTFQLLIFN